MSKKALGKGLNSLFPSKETNNPNIASDNRKEIQEEFLEPKIQEAIKEAKMNPRISLWSLKSAALLKYLRKTTPEFSISEEAARLLENAIREEYPDKYDYITKQIERQQ